MANDVAGETIWVGAVAYDPKVVTIWEGMRRYFHAEARLPVEVVLFQSYEAQVLALLADPSAAGPSIDIGWNTNLAYLQSLRWSGGRCHAVAMRDTDVGWTTKIIALAGGPVRSIDDLRGRTLALGSRDSGHAAIMPVHFLSELGLGEGRDYRTLRFDLDLGKHGDTGTSELDVLRAVMDGRADAGAVGSPFWAGVEQQRLLPAGSVVEIWSSAPYSHCMFTARPGLSPDVSRRFAAALYAMDFDKPSHRPILEAEGLRRWVPPYDGYGSLAKACEQLGIFERQAPRSYAQ
ncbi:MAG: phosphate/phosphite/phosphonate ABC transporter substrate-binding protein [Vicinamibacterales bacterium]